LAASTARATSSGLHLVTLPTGSPECGDLTSMTPSEPSTQDPPI
jgi:hypothetical protein